MPHQEQQSSPTDLNLLFGILALQMDFINHEQLIVAMQTWLRDKNKPLGKILVEQNVLSPARLALLDALVQEHLKLHENDPRRSLGALASAGMGGTVPEDLLKMAGSDVEATLKDAVLGGKPAGNPRAASVGLRFRILRHHARGGLGTVYVALDNELYREVALKEIQDQHADNKESRARFLLEAEITGRLEHPGIVPVYGLGQYADGRPFYAMRFIKGDSLQDAIERFHRDEAAGQDPNERILKLRELLGRFIDVCNAIQYAHDRGVLHRDLKPGNIMLGKYGETLVVDWGLAKPIGIKEPLSEESSLRPRSVHDSMETMLGSAIGTPSFMSPEQAGGRLDQLGASSDVFSLGATLYCLLTGKAPIEAQPESQAAGKQEKLDLAAILKKVQQGDFPRPRRIKPSVDRALEAICLKAMSLEQADRYRSPRMLADDLEHWLADRPVGAWPEPWRVRARRFVQRHRTLVTSAAGALVMGVLSLIVLNVILTANNKMLAESNNKERIAKEDAHAKKLEADQARKKADEARTKAERAQEETADALALNTTMLAQSRWNEHQIDMANDFLDDVPPQFRFSGWRFLRKKFEGGYCTLYGHLSPVNGVVLDQTGRYLASASSDRTVKLWDARTGEDLAAFKGHASGATAVAISPDGQWLASASWDSTVKVWDIHDARKEPRTFKHHARVGNVVFHPDGKYLASASDDGLVTIWELHTGKDVLTLKGHTGPVRGLAFSPDGKRIASGGDDGVVKIWDASVANAKLATRTQAVAALEGHADKVWSVAFSPDGRRLASASDDDSVKVWDGRDELFTLTGHRNDVRCVTFSPDGQFLASAGYDKTIKIWDANVHGQELQTLWGHTSAVVGVSFSPDGQRLASASADKTVKLWDARGMQEILICRHKKTVNFAIFSGDGERLATAGDDHAIRLWDTRTGRPVWPPGMIEGGHTMPVRSLAFSPDDRRLASAGDDRTVKVWDAHTGKVLWSTDKHTREVRSVAFSPDGELLASGSDDGTVKIWNARDGKEMATLAGHAQEVWCVAFSPAGQRLASASRDMTVKLWNLTNGHEYLTLKGHNDVVSSVAFSPDGRRLASASYDHTIKIWDADAGQELFPIQQGHGRPVASVAFHPDGQRLASGCQDGSVKMWDAMTGLELLPIPGHKRGVQSVAFSRDGDYLVTAGEDHTARVWDVHSGKEPLGLKCHKSGIRSVAFSPDRRRLVWASWDGSVTMWDAVTGNESTLSPAGSASDRPSGAKVTQVACSPHGDSLATAGENGTVRLWNPNGGKEIRILKGHTGPVLCVAYDHDGRVLASGGGDHYVKIWDVNTGQELHSLKGHTHEVRSVAFRADGKVLASAGYDGTVKLWDVKTGALLRSFDEHHKWVMSVSFGSSGSVISRDFSEIIMVWDAATGMVQHRGKDPNPSSFPAAMLGSSKRKSLALITANRIQIIDLASPAGEELAYRHAMSRLKPWWHEEQALHWEKEKNWYAAGFHWNWVVHAEPTNMEHWQHLDACCRQSSNWSPARSLCLRLARERPELDWKFPTEISWMNFFLAAAHHSLGHKDRARVFFDRAQLPNNAGPQQKATFGVLRGEAARELGLE